jgi:release factor glutamine methyltransferase
VTIHARVAASRQRLRDAGIPPDEADLDARLLAEHALGWTTERYIVDGPQAEPAGFTERYDAFIARRAAREPYAYIVGREEFWGLDLEVTPAVLIPRPETELVVESALELIPEGAHATICDVGTGSGCIAIAIAHDRPDAAVTAIDISSSALAVARRNAERHRVTSRVKFREGDLFAGVSERFDLIVSNPPYVPERDRPTIQAEVGRYEPATALFAGADGLDAIRRLLADAPSRLRPGAHLVFEFGYGQADAIDEAIANAPGLEAVAIRPDLQGIPRVAVARRTADRA